MAILREGAKTADGRAGERGQSLVEFGIGALVIALLLMGLLDFARAYYYNIGIHGAAYSGARHAAWFDFGSNQNKYLDDSDILSAVNQGLAGSHLPTVSAIQGTCPGGTGGVLHNPPYASSYYPTTANTAYVYVCYTTPGGGSTVGTRSSAPAPYDYSWRGGDVNVIVLMNYGLVTSFMQNVLNAAGGINIASNAHFAIQGGY